MEDLQQAVKSARLECEPRVLVVINPGNPTGIILYTTYILLRNFAVIVENCHGLDLRTYSEITYQNTPNYLLYNAMLIDLATGQNFPFQVFSSRCCLSIISLSDF